LRRFLGPFFRAAEVAKLEPGIRASVTRLIDEFIERGSCELIGEFARPLAGDVVFRQVLGLPDSEIDEAYHWTLAIISGPVSGEAKIIYEKYTALVAGLLDRRRSEPPRDDVVDAILHEHVSDRPLSPDEMRRTVMHLITAGLDTTAHALGNIAVRLARAPAERERLASDPASIPAAIEEFLRIDPPAGGLVRTAQRDMMIGGQGVRAGERVLLLVAGANRDPRAFDEPETFHLERGPSRNLAFGYGAHLCLGIHLARLELRVALEELLSRLGPIKLVDEEIHYDSGCSRGPKRVNLTFAPAARPS
jgi:cytochrome P450